MAVPDDDIGVGDDIATFRGVDLSRRHAWRDRGLLGPRRWQIYERPESDGEIEGVATRGSVPVLLSLFCFSDAALEGGHLGTVGHPTPRAGRRRTGSIALAGHPAQRTHDRRSENASTDRRSMTSAAEAVRDPTPRPALTGISEVSPAEMLPATTVGAARSTANSSSCPDQRSVNSLRRTRSGYSGGHG
jgi:hypothetical protein